MFLYEAKSLGKYLTKIFSFVNGQYVAQIKIPIVKQIECADSALGPNKIKKLLHRIAVMRLQ